MKTVAGILKHAGIVAGGVFLIIVLPLLCTGNAAALYSDVDAVTSSTVVLDAPSGSYVVLINRELHTDEDNLAEWVNFFSGGDILYIFEDVSCSVASSDAAGIDMAQSYQSRLPENQMVVKTEDPTLLLSRADAGLFDIIVMSREFAEAYTASTAYSDSVIVIEVSD